MITRKFSNAKLVKDFSNVPQRDDDRDIHFTKKSRIFIENWAHAPVFVFFRNGENLGVGNELEHTCSMIQEKISQSVVFLESGLNVGTQVRGSIKLGATTRRLSYEKFKTDIELCDLTFGHCRKILDRLFYYIG